MFRPARLALALVLLSSLAACTSPPAPTACPTATATPTLPPPLTPTATAPPPTPSPAPECTSDTIYEGPRYRVHIPCGAVAGDATFRLGSGLGTGTLSGGQRLLISVNLELFTWENRPTPLDTMWSFTFSESISITFRYGHLDLRHVDPAGLAVYLRRRGWPDWQRLPAVVDPSAGEVTVFTRDVGSFRLQAPLRCPENSGEADDVPAFELWPRYPRVNGPLRRRLLDTAEDEDWFLERAVAGVTYTVETRDLSPGMDTLLMVLDEHYNPVAVEDKVVAGASHLQWQAADDGIYYIRVTPVPGSATGCDAFYSLAFTAPRARLTLLYDGLVEYLTSAGLVTLPEAGGVLDPGLYHFRFDGEWVGYRVRSGEQRERVAIVKLVDSAGGALPWGAAQYRGKEGQWLWPLSFYDSASTWACPLPEEQTVLEVRMSLEGTLWDKTQDISADPMIVFQTGRVRSASGACTHYRAGGEWRPFYTGELLPGTYSFRFDDGTPDTEYTVVAGQETVIH